MCGIVGGVAQRDIAQILLEGLKRLEYRGYDSAGLSVTDKEANIQNLLDKAPAKVIHIASHGAFLTKAKPSQINR